METHDFTNAKIGDKVSHPIYGNGLIVLVKPYSEYYLTIVFEDIDGKKLFYRDGRYTHNDKSPSLYHGHNTFQIIATPVSPYKEGEWIAVSGLGKYWFIEQFIKMDGDKAISKDGNGKEAPNKFHKTISELNSELNNL